MKTLTLLLLSLPMFAQIPSAERNLDQLTGVDAIIAFVQANMSESLVMKHIKREGKAYNLTAADLLKLQKAGVSEKIIEFMMDPQEPAVATPAQSTPKPDPAASVSAEESAGGKKEGKRGFFGRAARGMEDRAKRLGQNTLDSAGRTVDKTAAAAEDRANRTVEDGQEKVDRAVQPKLDSGERKATGALDQNSNSQTTQQDRQRKR